MGPKRDRLDSGLGVPNGNQATAHQRSSLDIEFNDPVKPDPSRINGPRQTARHLRVSNRHVVKHVFNRLIDTRRDPRFDPAGNGGTVRL